jgi:hypothetical protein
MIAGLRLSGIATHDKLTLISTTLALLVFSACGAFFGVYAWKSSARPEMR